MKKIKKQYGLVSSYIVLKNNYALYKAILRHFGSFRAALEEFEKQ